MSSPRATRWMCRFALLASLALTACRRSRDSLGSFVEDRARTLARDCVLPDDHSSDDGPVFRCTIVLDAVDCSCHASATLFQAENRKNVRLIQLQIDHCPHQAATRTIVDHLDWLLSDDDRAPLEQDVDDPGHDARPVASRATSGRISTRRIYGDRVVELDWSRDAYRQPDGSVAAQPTESYFVAIRPRTGSDAPQTTASKEPRVTAAPQCPR